MTIGSVYHFVSKDGIAILGPGVHHPVEAIKLVVPELANCVKGHEERGDKKLTA